MKPRSSPLPVALGCFALPGLLFLLLCAVMGFAPFGSGSILSFDLSDQYVEFLCALKEGDLFFSWNTALGGSYMGTFSYYVSSPLSLLTLLCPNENMPVAVVFLIALKLSLAGLTFSWLLRRRTGRCDITTLGFSLAYGLMSYAMAYGTSFMWLDGLVWLPILLIGCHAVAEGKRPVWLSLALAVSFVSSWYISYMLGLFCALYLLWLCLCNGERLVTCLAALGRLLLRALPALLLSAWVWLPTVLSMFSGKLSGGGDPWVFGFNWPLTTFFYKLFVPGAYDSITYTGSAWLYCSLPAALLAVVWFVQKRSWRQRLITVLFVDGLALCLWFAPLDRVWHLFQAPHSYPGRWSFLFSALVLLLGYDALHRLLTHHPLPRLVPVLLVLTLALDMTANGLMVLHKVDGDVGYDSYESYRDYKREMQPLVDTLLAQDPNTRTVSEVQRSRNEPAAFGYKGVTSFSSSYDANVNSLLRSMGLAQDWFWVTGLGSTPVTDLLLSVGWRISDGSLPQGYEPVDTGAALTLYRNTLSSSPVYWTDATQPVGGKDSFGYQNRLLTAVSGVDEPFFLSVEAQQVDEANATTWTVMGDGSPLYGQFPRVEDCSALLYVNGQLHGPLYTPETNCIQYLGTFPAGEPVALTLITTAPAARRLAALYALDLQALDRAAQALEQRAMTVTRWEDNVLQGTLTAPADGWLYTSVPAQKGWTVQVDGQRVDTTVFENALLAVPVAAGEHTVTFTYHTPGLTASLVLAAVGGLWLVLLARKKKAK